MNYWFYVFKTLKRTLKSSMTTFKSSALHNLLLPVSLCLRSVDKCSRYGDIQQNGTVDSTSIREILTAFSGIVTKQLLFPDNVICHRHLELCPVLCEHVSPSKPAVSLNNCTHSPFAVSYYYHKLSASEIIANMEFSGFAT